jgi:hypothetical protein
MRRNKARMREHTRLRRKIHYYRAGQPGPAAHTPQQRRFLADPSRAAAASHRIGLPERTASRQLSLSPRNGILRFQDIIRAFRAFEARVPRIRTRHHLLWSNSLPLTHVLNDSFLTLYSPLIASASACFSSANHTVSNVICMPHSDWLISSTADISA